MPRYLLQILDMPQHDVAYAIVMHLIQLFLFLT